MISNRISFIKKHNILKHNTMKKFRIYSLLILLLTSITVYAQVGINTPVPASTIDVTAKNATGTATNADGILIPRVDRQRAQSMTGVATSTMIYVNSVATGTQTGTAINIGTIGFYFFDGSVWARLSATSTNAFVPTVVASGINSTGFVINDGAGFVQFYFNVSTNDGSWNAANNTYTVPKAGYYQVSLQANEKPSANNNSFAWNLKYDSNLYQYTSLSNVLSAYNYNAGGVIVMYFTQGQVLQLGGVPCKGCSGTNYTIGTRSFTIVYLGT